MITGRDFLTLLQTCGNSKHLNQIQTQVITHGFQHNHNIIPKILSLSFTLLFQPQHSKLWFDIFLSSNKYPRPTPNSVSWNVMFKGYTNAGLYRRTLDLFDDMRKRDVEPNRYTFTFLLKSCAKIGDIRKGEKIQCISVKTGFQSNMFVGTALIDVYSVCGLQKFARKVFDEMPVKNIVAWTAILSAYLLGGDLVSARDVFDCVIDRDIVVWNTMISGYLKSGELEMAQQLFVQMPHKDLICWNTMLQGYANNGHDVEVCVKFFNEMPERNVFSWNGLIAGYIAHGQFSQALHVFSQMLREPNITPSEATIVMVLSACSKLGSLDLGMWVHVYAYGNEFRSNLNVGNGLIDMYSKCGNVNAALVIFHGMEFKDVVSWNAIIGGLAMHGFGTEALDMFSQMSSNIQGVKPDGITFVGILSACTHMGFVEQGFRYLNLMVEHYNILPWIEHYGCIVDLLGRSGLAEEALHFIQTMPMEPDQIMWSSLVAACFNRGNVNLAEMATKEILKFQPDEAANHVALSNVYGYVGRWKNVAETKLNMRQKSSGKKLPGCSLIELNWEVAEFYSGDFRHSQTEEIYKMLVTLNGCLKKHNTNDY